MTSQRISHHAPPGSLLKHPAPTRRKDFGRSPREHDRAHLDAVRDLPCIKCGVEGFSEAAHVRMNSAAYGKRTGTGEKPSDKWSLSLCPSCHRLDQDSQHKVGEAIFWNTLGINPLIVCQELYAKSPDVIAMRAVVFVHMAKRK